jgi:hypothetical protein
MLRQLSMLVNYDSFEQVVANSATLVRIDRASGFQEIKQMVSLHPDGRMVWRFAR